MKTYPFKFLDAYEKKDKDIFFGREDQIDELYNMVFQSNIMLVYGPSGTGKTSLIQCGLANRFKPHQWMDFNIRRGTNLNQSLDKTLNDELKNLALGTNELDGTLESQFRSLYLHYLTPVFLIFDQFEELYILGDIEEQTAFIQKVKQILLLKQPVHVILSIREEYIGHLYEFEKAVPQLLSKKIRIEPMDYPRVEKVMSGITDPDDAMIKLIPAEKESFIKRLFETVRGKEQSRTIQLPYLQVFLDKLYESITGDKTHQKPCTFTLDKLEKFQGIEDVLGQYLKEQVEVLSKKLALQNKFFRENDCWKVLSVMVTRKGTRAPVSKEEILQRLGNNFNLGFLDQLLKELEDRRIIRQSESQGLFEIAHDSLGPEIANKPLIFQTKRAEDIARKGYTNHDRLSIKDVQIIDMVIGEMNLTKEERSYVESQRRRLKVEKFRARILAIAIIAVLICLLIFLYKEKRSADRAKQLAQEGESKVRAALASEQTALKNETEQKNRAEAETKRANNLAKEANTAKLEAQAATRVATEKEKEASNSAAIARQKQMEALAEKAKAEAFQREADTQATKAIASRKEAERQKYLTTSITLALQSTVAQSDTDRVLLALQSFYLNKTYNGNAWIPEITEALVKAAPAQSVRQRDSIGSAILDIIRAGDKILLITDAGEIRQYQPEKGGSISLWKNRDFHYAANSGHFDPSSGRLYIANLNHRQLGFSWENNQLFRKPAEDQPASPASLATASGFLLTAGGVSKKSTPGVPLIHFDPGQYGATMCIDSAQTMLAAGTRNGWLYLTDFGVKDYPLFKREFQTPHTAINDIAFDRKAEFIATGGSDFHLRLTRIDLLDERPPMEYAFDDWVTSVFFLDRMQLLVGTAGGYLYRVNYDPASLSELLRKSLPDVNIRKNRIVIDQATFLNYLKNGK